MTVDTLIIGGGLSGLHAARLLQGQGSSFCVLEGRGDFGGRIRSTSRGEAFFEMGPSWYWPETNPRVARFVEEFGLPYFTQHTKGDVLIDDGVGLRRQLHRTIDPRSSHRLTKGSRSLIDAQLSRLPEEQLFANHRVTRLSRGEGIITATVTTPDGEKTFSARNVILALPLRLIEASIEFAPALPAPISHRFRTTPTWMAGEAKFFALYETPFWRDEGLSGTVFSNHGPLAETHDASHPDGSAALFGFFNLGPKERQSLGDRLIPECLGQLGQYFGPEATRPTETLVMDWATESLTATALDDSQSEHPSYHLPEEARSLWDGTVRFAGTEAASLHGGYLEGAFEAAEDAVSGFTQKGKR